ncbi:hypothetical protein AMJ85_03255, partial [candidate division BRC1 bacterium SM23_51]
MAHKVFPTPWGYVGAAATRDGLVRVVLPHSNAQVVERELRRLPRSAVPSEAAAILELAQRQIVEYLAGDRQEFDLPIARLDASSFALGVWRACCRIPY